MFHILVIDPEVRSPSTRFFLSFFQPFCQGKVGISGMDLFWSEHGSVDKERFSKEGKHNEEKSNNKLTGMGPISSIVRDYDRLVT
jgi:hypothetical protein